MQTNHKDKLKIGLCLSGGGVRASLYHLGVLKAFAEQGALGQISGISSVSGGSLLIGLVYHFNKMKWPSDEEFINHVYPSIFKLLTSTNLQLQYAFRLLRPWNLKHLTSAANVMADTIYSNKCGWGVIGLLHEVTGKPVWSLNGTTIESGKRFRFKTSKFDTMGDYTVGYTNAPDLRLADVMAISAAFPGLIGPFKLMTQKYKWHKFNNTEHTIIPNNKYLHIMDGGIYDNLGMEAYFDVTAQDIKQKSKEIINSIIVSDASLPLGEYKWQWRRFLKRSLRLTDIYQDQIRALRIRSFIGFLKKESKNGLYLSIEQNANDIVKSANKLGFVSPDNIVGESLSESQVNSVYNYPTKLHKVFVSDAENIIRHGYESFLNNRDIYWK